MSQEQVVLEEPAVMGEGVAVVVGGGVGGEVVDGEWATLSKSQKNRRRKRDRQQKAMLLMLATVGVGAANITSGEEDCLGDLARRSPLGDDRAAEGDGEGDGVGEGQGQVVGGRRRRGRRGGKKHKRSEGGEEGGRDEGQEEGGGGQGKGKGGRAAALMREEEKKAKGKLKKRLRWEERQNTEAELLEGMPRGREYYMRGREHKETCGGVCMGLALAKRGLSAMDVGRGLVTEGEGESRCCPPSSASSSSLAFPEEVLEQMKQQDKEWKHVSQKINERSWVPGEPHCSCCAAPSRFVLTFRVRPSPGGGDGEPASSGGGGSPPPEE